MSVQILQGDCREVLKTLAAESVDCVVTSPPYFGLRDYGVAGQIGLEATPDAYVEELVGVFRECRRVLKNSGTLWLNLGDSYASTTSGTGARGGSYAGERAQWHGASSRREIPAGLKPKDLIGIPWMVAFALRAPQYLGAIDREVDRAWLAALIDGEGCLTILETTSPHGSGNSYPPILQVRMCDRECIDKAMEITRTGGESPAQYPASMDGQRPAFQWRIHGRRAADIIAEIYPFLLIKRKQAIVAWNHQAVRDGYQTKKGVKIPSEALEKQKVCRDLIQRLNKREAIDLPSWMIEPPQPFGPGWYLRSDVIWSKPNPMPESITDRPTKAHEYVFLLSKSPRYFYDADAIAEASIFAGKIVTLGEKSLSVGQANGANVRKTGNALADSVTVGDTRNKRSVWEVATQPFSEAHFATFPPDLIEPCIKAGCPEHVCAKCGAPWMRDVLVESRPNAEPNCDSQYEGYRGISGGVGNDRRARIDRGFIPSCDCHFEYTAPPGVVLDPFGGAGTTALVADRLGRNSILIELNPEYAAMSERRLNGDAGMFASVERQPSLLDEAAA